MNTLYYGDNLDIMREYIPDDSVDLVYLDPPFNSKQAYNVLFRDKEGHFPPSQIEAFDDTWHWTDASEEFLLELSKPQYPPELFQMLNAFRSFLGTSDLMAYLVMMAIRLWEISRTMKNTGSIYLHCDPTAGHYLKIIMDRVFGVKNFRNDIIWKRTFSHGDAGQFGRNYDNVLFYTKTEDYVFNKVYVPYSEEYIERFFRNEENGRKYQLITLTGAGATGGDSGKPWRGYDPTLRNRHWSVPRRTIEALVGKTKAEKMSIFEKLEFLLESGHIVFSKQGVPRFKEFLDEMAGAFAQAVWDDIPPVSAHSKERLGYPTQKPVALLERVINASSNENDVIMDPFCGCGTALAAAEKLNRKWIGIDITILAVNLIEKRLKDHFPDAEYKVIGIPSDFAGAQKLASSREGKFLFERWFVIALGGQPFRSFGGGDSGIDGFLYTRDVKGQTHRIMVSVKGGHFGPGAVRDLKGVVEREGAIAGLLLTLNPPSKEAISEAASAGRFELPNVARSYPKIQILTAAEYFEGKRPELPDTSETLKKAERISRDKGTEELPLK